MSVHAEPWLVYGGTEIGNVARTAAYIQNTEDRNCCRHRITACDPCPATIYDPCLNDGAGGFETYTTPDADPAPWYSAANPASADFLGLIISEMQVRTSTRKRSSIARSHGSGFSRQRRAGRVIEVSGRIYALSCCGMDYGMAWLEKTLGVSEFAPCSKCDAEVVTCCDPADPLANRFTLCDVAITDGPNFTDDDSGRCECCPSCCRVDVDFVLEAGSPYLFGCPEECGTGTFVSLPICVDDLCECVVTSDILSACPVGPNPFTLNVAVTGCDPSEYDIRWYIDGVQFGNSLSFTVDPSIWPLGVHTVRLEVVGTAANCNGLVLYDETMPCTFVGTMGPATCDCVATSNLSTLCPITSGGTVFVQVDITGCTTLTNVDKVEFFVDGVLEGTVPGNAGTPYIIPFDTSTYSGTHSLRILVSGLGDCAPTILDETVSCDINLTTARTCEELFDCGVNFGPNSIQRFDAQAAAVDANSACVVAELNRQQTVNGPAGSQGVWIETVNFSSSISFVCGDTPLSDYTEYTVVMDRTPQGSNYSDPALNACTTAVPILNGCQPAPGSDEHLAVIDARDPNNVIVYDFFHFRYTGATTATHFEGGVIEDACNDDGIMPCDSTEPHSSHAIGNAFCGNPSTRDYGAAASAFPVGSGMMLQQESIDIMNGLIDHFPHVLRVHVNEQADAWTTPMCKTDAQPNVPDCADTNCPVIMGDRFRFPSNIFIDPTWHPIAQAMVRTIRDYGMIVMDKGGNAIGFYAEKSCDGSNPWPGIWGTPSTFNAINTIANQIPWGSLEQIARGTVTGNPNCQ